MAVYNLSGNQVNNVYDVDGETLLSAYNINGYDVLVERIDYSNNTYTQKWASKGISSTQGFDIYDGKVFWIAKSGDSTIPSNCYVWNLADGSQALDTAYITVYSGHGNNVAFDYPKVYFAPAYTPSRVYENVFSDGYTAALTKTILLPDNTSACEACLDEHNKTILLSIGHLTNTCLISKWDLSNLTDNGDDTYTPNLLYSVESPKPTNDTHLQGSRMHDGILWYTCGYSGGSTEAYIYGVDPITGEVLYAIDCETTSEPEGIAFVEESGVYGGYVMYVGFQGMMLRRYTFNS